MKIKNGIAQKKGVKAKFAVEEELSDPESYACLTEV
jgi:hypothetical protein